MPIHDKKKKKLSINGNEGELPQFDKEHLQKKSCS